MPLASRFPGYVPGISTLEVIASAAAATVGEQLPQPATSSHHDPVAAVPPRPRARLVQPGPAIAAAGFQAHCSEAHAIAPGQIWSRFNTRSTFRYSDFRLRVR